MTAVQAIIVAVLASLVPAVIGIVWAQDLLRLMGADAWSIEHGYRYTQWMLGQCGDPAAVRDQRHLPRRRRRGHRDARAVARNGLNILLCPDADLRRGPIPALGIEGAAIAT
jgi:Na+-driven multidrug efflux pump